MMRRGLPGRTPTNLFGSCQTLSQYFWIFLVAVLRLLCSPQQIRRRWLLHEGQLGEHIYWKMISFVLSWVFHPLHISLESVSAGANGQVKNPSHPPHPPHQKMSRYWADIFKDTLDSITSSHWPQGGMHPSQHTHPTCTIWVPKNRLDAIGKLK